MPRNLAKYATDAERLAAVRESKRAWKMRNKRPPTEAERAHKAAYDARYRKANASAITARILRWKHADHRRRFSDTANQRAAMFGLAGRLDWRELEPGDCAYCFGPADSWDHVVPMSRGGPNDVSNLVPCCRDCNHDKRNRTPDEWIAGAPFPRGSAGPTSLAG